MVHAVKLLAKIPKICGIPVEHFSIHVIICSGRAALQPCVTTHSTSCIAQSAEVLLRTTCMAVQNQSKFVNTSHQKHSMELASNWVQWCVQRFVLEHSAETMQAVPNMLELVPKGVNKGSGMRKLLANLELPVEVFCPLLDCTHHYQSCVLMTMYRSLVLVEQPGPSLLLQLT